MCCSDKGREDISAEAEHDMDMASQAAAEATERAARICEMMAAEAYTTAADYRRGAPTDYERDVADKWRSNGLQLKRAAANIRDKNFRIPT